MVIAIGKYSLQRLRVRSPPCEQQFLKQKSVFTGESMRLIKRAERGLTMSSLAAYTMLIQSVNKYKPNPSFTPKWSDKPLLKSWQKSKPTLGWPRTTDSLCPNCVIEAEESIVSGKQDVSVLINEKVGEIKAQIIERDGEVWMVKDCPIHGHFEDMMAIDVKF